MKLPVIGAVLKPLRGEASLHMEAPAEKVWALVSDVTRIGEFSPETFEARWSRGSTGRRSAPSSRDT